MSVNLNDIPSAVRNIEKMQNGGRPGTTHQGIGTLFPKNMSERGMKRSSSTLVDQLVSSSRTNGLTPLPNGSRGIVAQQKLAQQRGFKENLQTASNGASEFRVPDAMKSFTTGHRTIPVNPFRQVGGIGGFEQRYDDVGVIGGASSKADYRMTDRHALEPSAYGKAYYNMGDMHNILPEQSLVWTYIPDDDIARKTTTMHTISTINRLFRSVKAGKDPSFESGAVFAKQWRFDGVLVELCQHQSLMPSSVSTLSATTSKQGPWVIKNIFESTGRDMYAGDRLYILLRYIVDPACDIERDIKFADERCITNGPYYDNDYDVGGDPASKREKRRGFWQLCPYVSNSDTIPPMELWNGPDWSGAYYFIGRVTQSTSATANKRRFKTNAHNAVHSPDISISTVAFGKLRDLNMAVCS